MLNRIQVMQALAGISGRTSHDLRNAYASARELWDQIRHDELFLAKVHHTSTSLPVPSWHAPLDHVVAVHPIAPPYQVASVDGSQVYPDRHQGTPCYLINIGSIVVSYGTTHQPVQLASQPFVFDGVRMTNELPNGQELINCHRQELELQVGLEILMRIARNPSPTLLLFDGSLIFWNLEAKNSVLSSLFLQKYIDILESLHLLRVPYAGYISMPRSRELLNILRLKLCNFNTDQKELYALLDPLADPAVTSFFLHPNSRSQVFGNRATITAHYPPHLKTHFFYLHIGNEIGRVEIPAWIAQDETVVDQVASIILDQCHKGGGFPTVLAEAHEQAVVKGPDREFFYHALQKEGIQNHMNIQMSPKEQRKRRMNV